MQRNQWEYVHVQVGSMGMNLLTRTLNDAGARGWELVSVTDSDRMVGVNAIVALLRRPIEPLSDPEDASTGWKPDPSGRYPERYWDGEAWTFRTRLGADEHRDPPTTRTPAQVPQ